MICIEDVKLEPPVARARDAVLAVLTPHHPSIFRFTHVEGLEAYLEAGLDRLHKATRMLQPDLPRKLSRCILFYRHPRAMAAVSERMCPGFEPVLFRQPDCWLELAGNLDAIREYARLLGGPRGLHRD